MSFSGISGDLGEIEGYIRIPENLEIKRNFIFPISKILQNLMLIDMLF